LAQSEAEVPAVVHDILSFSTTVSLAVERGIEVLPYPNYSAQSARYADEQGAELAGRRGQPDGKLTLSPQSIAQAKASLPARLVLPSPNGATISAALAAQGIPVLASCFRNAAATARYLYQQQPRRVLSVAAGERWPDGSLRPAIEDLLGAAYLIAELSQLLGEQARLSDQALVALAGLGSVESSLSTVISRSPSGLELAEAGYRGDVDLACQCGTSSAVALYYADSASFRAV